MASNNWGHSGGHNSYEEELIQKLDEQEQNVRDKDLVKDLARKAATRSQIPVDPALKSKYESSK